MNASFLQIDAFPAGSGMFLPVKFCSLQKYFRNKPALLLFCAAMCARLEAADDAPSALANFVDVAQQAGLNMANVFGGKYTKKYIIETTGTGVAIFDYDNDGWPDIFIVNGTTLQPQPGPAPTNHLYRNNHDGTFTDVTAKAGLTSSGWGQGVRTGDYDNDGL